MFAQVIVKWVREHTVLPYGVDCTDIGQLRYPFCPPFIIHSQFKKGTEIGSLFAYCCGFFLWKLNLGSLIFLNKPEMREATLSVSE